MQSISLKDYISGVWRGFSIAILWLLITGSLQPISAQPGGLQPLNSAQREILDGPSRKQVRCDAGFSRPEYDFHFRFSVQAQVFIDAQHAGFSDSDDRESSAEHRTLLLLVRIRPLEERATPSYLNRRVRVSSEFRRQGKVGLGFGFFLGDGPYQLDWMIETEKGEVCSGRRRFRPEASRSGIRPTLGPGQSYFEGQTPPAPWWLRERDRNGFRLKILVNIPPFKDRRPLFGRDLFRIEAILTWLAYHPRVSGISLVVFNLKDQRVIFRQPLEQGLPDPGELADAIRSLTNNQVRLETLAENADSRFLSRLLVEELSDTETYDAVVLLGPRSPLELDAQATASEIEAAATVYYFKYRFFQAGARWSDPLQKITRELGGRMFPIRRPQDLWESSEKMMDLIERNSR